MGNAFKRYHRYIMWSTRYRSLRCRFRRWWSQFTNRKLRPWTFQCRIGWCSLWNASWRCQRSTPLKGRTLCLRSFSKRSWCPCDGLRWKWWTCQCRRCTSSRWRCLWMCPSRNLLNGMCSCRMSSNIRVETVERVVEVPQVEVVERQVHVPQTVIQDVVREVRVPMVQERIRHVRKQVVQTVEKIVHVPQLQHVEVPEVTVREFTRQPSVTAFPLVSANVPMASVVVSAPATTVATIPPPVLQNSVSIPLLPAMTPPAPAPREVRIMPSTTPGRP